MKKKLLFYIFCCVVKPAYSQINFGTMRIGFTDSVVCEMLTFIPLYAVQPTAKKTIIKPSGGVALNWQELSPKTSADVHVLMVDNNSNETLLVPVGTAIAGGYQDRVVASSVLIPPRSKGNYVSTFCIEKGRWGGKKKPLKPTVPVDGLLKQLLISSGKQTAIWQYIHELYQAKGLKTSVQPYHAVKPIWQRTPPCFTQLLTKQQALKDSLIGWAVVSGGSFIAAEACNTPELFLQIGSSTLYQLYEYGLQTNKALLPRTANDALRNLFSPASQPNYLQQYGKGYYQEDALFHLICY